MDIENILKEMTFEEKARILSGVGNMQTHALDRLNIPTKNLADGPHGVRLEKEKNCTHFPNLCCLAASWDTDVAHKMGEALAYDCIEHDVDMLLSPGVNIKRTPLCGRNFEYFSEDPILAGELSASYINGLQGNGVAASLKHFAANNQEKNRNEINAEIDERTLREIYLKAFEIAVKKSNPVSVMCSYNKINSVWASENPFILKEILKDEWGFDGFVISDWGAVQDTVKSMRAGLDFEMPANYDIVAQLKEGVDKGKISMKQIDDAARRVLKFLLKEKPETPAEYNRDEQHRRAKEIAASGIVLLKNENNVLPLTSNKYKKIAVLGEYAESPLIAGQGSAEVHQMSMYTDSPLKELKKLLPETEFVYDEVYQKGSFSSEMIWPTLYSKDFSAFLSDVDAVLIFAGSMVSEESEKNDRRSIELNPKFDMVAEAAMQHNKNVVLVLQTGSAVVLGDYANKAPAVVEMWLSGESAGSAIAEVLCGVVNPSGKLPETFPTKLRTDMDHSGSDLRVEYNEKLNVGYRYYDKHTDEIAFPFGHGLSYTDFEYSDIKVTPWNDKSCNVSLKVKNVGDCSGAEIVQLYISDIESSATKPLKELKKFKKVFLKQGEEKKISFTLSSDDFAYYNTSYHKWIAEDGAYAILIGSSSQDIRLRGSVVISGETPYTILKAHNDLIG